MGSTLGGNKRHQSNEPSEAADEGDLVLVEVVDDSRHLADGVHLVCHPPDAAMERSACVNLQWACERGLGVGVGLGVANVVDEEGTHDGVGGLLVHDLHGLEVVHATIGRSELLVVHHGGGGGGGGDVGGHGVALRPHEHAPPVLQPLGEGVVGALGDHQPIYHVEGVLVVL